MGFVYKLVCNTKKLIYIGSTTTKLHTRLAKHKCDKSCISRIIIDNNNYEIIMLEEVSDNLLLIREQYYMDITECININRAIRTHDDLKKSRRESYYKNKEKNWEVVRERQNKKYICECGGKYTHQNKKRHFNSKKHINFCIRTSS